MKTLIETVDAYNAATKTVYADIATVSKSMEEGLCPDLEQQEKLVASIESLREKYVRVVEAARNVAPRASHGTSVQDLVRLASEEWDHSWRAYLAAMDKLSQFISVRSPEEMYEAALAPFQDEAMKSLAAMIDADEPVIADEAARQEKKAAVFLDALDSVNLSSDNELAARLSQAFPASVVMGLAFGKYERRDAEADEMLERLLGCPIGDMEEELQDALDSTGPGLAATSTSGTPCPDQDTQAADNDDGKPADVAQGEPEKRTVKSVNPVKRTKNVSAASFKRELESLPWAYALALPLLMAFAPITSSGIHTLIGGHYAKKSLVPEPDEVEAALYAMERKAIAVRFKAKDVTFWCPTRYAALACSKESVKNIKVRSRSLWEFPLYDTGLKADSSVEEEILLEMANATSSMVDFVKVFCDVSDMKFNITSSPTYVDKAWVIPFNEDGYSYLARFSNKSNGLCADVFGACLTGYDPDEVTEDMVSPITYLVHDGKVGEWTRNGWKTLAGEPIWGERLADAEEAENADEEGGAQSPASPVQEEREAEVEPAVEEGQSSEEAKGLMEGPSQESKEEGRPTDDAAVEDAEDASSGNRFLSMAEGELPSDEDVCDAAIESLGSHDQRDRNAKVGEALALALAGSLHDGYAKSLRLSRQMELAFDAGWVKIARTSESIVETFDGAEGEVPALRLGALLLSAMVPSMAYDHGLMALMSSANGTFGDDYPGLEPMRGLVVSLDQALRESPEHGLSERALAMLESQEEHDARMASLSRRAADLEPEIQFSTGLAGLGELSKACFGRKSDLHRCMVAVRNNDVSERAFVSDVLKGFAKDPDRLAFPLLVDKDDLVDRIQEEWRAATKGHKTSRIRTLDSIARRQAVDGFDSRIQLAAEWLDAEKPSLPEHTLAAVKACVRDVEAASAQARSGLEAMDAIDRAICERVVDVIDARIRGKVPDRRLLAKDFLRTGLLSVGEDWVPVLNPGLSRIEGAEPVRNVCRHIGSARPDWDVAENAIVDINSPTFDNIAQLRLIYEFLENKERPLLPDADMLQKIEEAAEEKANRLRDALEMHYAFGTASEEFKEDAIAKIEAFRGFYFEQQDFGQWRHFVERFEDLLESEKERHVAKMRTRLEEAASSPQAQSARALLKKVDRCIDEGSLAVAEEFLNRFDAGETSVPGGLDADYNEGGFTQFVQDEYYDELYNACTRAPADNFSTVAQDYVRSHCDAGWDDRLVEEGVKVVAAWPSFYGKMKGKDRVLANLHNFLRSVGIDSRGEIEATLTNSKREHRYRVPVKPAKRGRASYSHPIASFGTAAEPYYNVIALKEKPTATEITKAADKMNLSGVTIYLIDDAMTLAEKRDIVEAFHTQTSRLHPFIIIDHVLALHLALHEKEKRLPLLLKCSLPFTFYQPFGVGTGPTADEMFSGRTQELRMIADPNGPCVVYGGRQLGKTALLQRAESIVRNQAGAYAVWVSILHYSQESDVAAAVASALREKAGIVVRESSTLKDIADAIEDFMKTPGCTRVLLMIDECDNFLENISKEGYAPLQHFVDLRRETVNRFKFVLAGTHNVSRAKNATANNGIFGQMGEPLCVRPLSASDAFSLISKPLSYIGFKIDKHPYLQLILANTNYYPGIIHFFGNRLVENMTQQYGESCRAVDDVPPFELTKDQLGAVMNQADLNNAIKQKFRLSLELDKRYFAIARCIALMTYDSRRSGSETNGLSGYDVADVLEYASALDVAALADENRTSCGLLLEEMMEMGILSKTSADSRRYKLRVERFLGIIGKSPDDILEDLIAANEEE